MFLTKTIKLVLEHLCYSTHCDDKTYASYLQLGHGAGYLNAVHPAHRRRLLDVGQKTIKNLIFQNAQLTIKSRRCFISL